jgi:hypothetical protein
MNHSSDNFFGDNSQETVVLLIFFTDHKDGREMFGLMVPQEMTKTA